MSKSKREIGLEKIQAIYDAWAMKIVYENNSSWIEKRATRLTPWPFQDKFPKGHRAKVLTFPSDSQRAEAAQGKLFG